MRGKAYDDYAKLPETQLDDYAALKRALLIRYELTAEAYRRKFRQVRKDKGETFAQMADRQDTYLRKWIHLSETDRTFDGIVDLIRIEQFKEALPSDVRTFVAEQGADTLADATQAADRFALAHADSKKRNSNDPSPAPQTTGQPDEEKEKFSQQPPAQPSEDRPKQVCHYCKKPGHVIANCPTRPKVNKQQYTVSCARVVSQGHPTWIQPAFGPSVTDQVQVNGETVQCLYDTGLTFDAIVSRRLVHPRDYTGFQVQLKGADHSILTDNAEVAYIQVKTRYVTGRIRAAVLDHPLCDLILGRRYVILGLPTAPRESAGHPRAEESSSTMANSFQCSAVDLTGPLSLFKKKRRRRKKKKEQGPQIVHQAPSFRSQDNSMQDRPWRGPIPVAEQLS